ERSLQPRHQIIIRGVRLNGRGVLAIALCVPVLGRADTSDRFARTLPLAADRPVRIEATIADLTIVGSDRSDLAVQIVRRAPSPADLAKYPVVVDEGAAAVTIAAVQAGDGRDPALKTEITIGAPSTAVFEAIRVFEGRVKLTNLKRACDL